MTAPGISNPIEDFLLKEYNLLREFYRGKDKQLLISHIGNLNQDRIISIAYFIENQLDNYFFSKKIKNKVYSIVVETLQNILFHSDRDENGDFLAFFVIGKDKKGFVIHASNIVKETTALKKAITEIKSLSNRKLNKLYLNKMAKTSNDTKNRAGLGLITIALKSDSNYTLDIKKFDDNSSVFTLTSKVEF